MSGRNRGADNNLSFNILFCLLILPLTAAIHEEWGQAKLNDEDTDLNFGHGPEAIHTRESFLRSERLFESDVRRLASGKAILSPPLDVSAELQRISKEQEQRRATALLKPGGGGYTGIGRGDCPTGYTGPGCLTVVCPKKSVLAATGGNSGVEWIESYTAPQCNNKPNVTFFVDPSIGSRLVIQISAANGQGKGLRPRGILYAPDGRNITAQQADPIRTRGIRYTFQDLIKNYGAGAYTISVSSFMDIPCNILVTAPTNLIVDGGFVTSPSDDFAQESIMRNAVEREPVNGAPSYFAMKVSGLTYPGLPGFVSFHRGAMERGGDQDDGRRANKCYNGGTLIQNDDDQRSGVCYCGQHYDGPRCEHKLCANGGTLDDDQNCVNCGDFSGTYCEHVKCRRTSGQSFDTEGRALVFVVRTSNTIVEARHQLSEGVGQFVEEYERQSPGYIKKFVFVLYGEGEVALWEEVDDWKDGLKHVFDYLEWFMFDQQNCTDVAYAALTQALQIPAVQQYSKSPIILITDVPPSDGGDQAQKDLFGRLAFYRGPVNTLLVKNSDCPVDTYSAGMRQLRRIAQFTQGTVATLNANQLKDVVNASGQSLRKWNQLIANDFLDSCTYAPSVTNFFVDTSMTNIAVSTAGGSIQVTVRDPTGAELVPQGPQLNSNSDRDINWITYVVNMAGNYRLEIQKDNTPCQIRVFGDGQYELFFGTSQNLRSDLDDRQPTFNTDTHVVARFSGITYPDPENLFAETTIWTNEGSSEHGGRTILYASNGIYRDSCDFNLYFRQWQCPKRDMLFYVNVYVTDQSGYTIMRTANGYCSSRPVTNQPATGCLNGGVTTDDGKCFCPQGWTDSRCETIVCQNYGVSKGDYCECVADTSTGMFCESLMCDNTNPDYHAKNALEINGRALMLMVHNSATTRGMVTSLVDYIHEALQDINLQNSKWITSYLLTSFDNNDWKEYDVTSDPNTFISQIQQLDDDNSKKQENSCEDLLIFETLYTLLSDYSQISERAIVYIFLWGLPKVTDQTLIESLYEMVEESQIQINIVEYAALICRYEISDPEVRVLIELATATGGNYYALNLKPGKALLTIPTLFSANLIYENILPDCSTPKQFYFPIDSQTQAFTVNIFGNLDGNPVYNPPSGSRTKFEQVQRPCDDGWTMGGLDNHCYLPQTDQKSWEAAKNVCRESNSALVTIYKQSVQDFLLDSLGDDVWIGLNDLRTASNSNPTWEWDQQNGALALSNTSKDFQPPWETNEPQTSSGNCVRMSKSGWRVADCTIEKSFACMRHPYDMQFKPNSRRALSRGTWSLSVKTVDDDEDTGCHVRIFSQSAIQVYNLFTDNNKIDGGYGQPTYGVSKKSNVIVAHATGFLPVRNDIPRASLQYAHFYTADQPKIKQVQTFDKRDTGSCMYEYVSSKFSCSENGYQIAYSGMDDYGYPFQRIKPAICYKPSGNCENGGVSHDYQCYCPDNYGGSRCQTTYCSGRGRNADTGIGCVCNDGWGGDPNEVNFCQYPLCNAVDGQPAEKPSAFNKTLVIVLDGSWTGNNKDLLTNLQAILTDVIGRARSDRRNWFINLAGIVAYDSARDDGPHVSQVFVETDTATFINKLVAEVNNNPYTSRLKSRLFNQAIIRVLGNSNIKPRSILYVLGDANNEDGARGMEALDTASVNHVTVSYYVLSDDTAPGGGKTYQAQPVRSMIDLSYNSGGNLYQLNYTDFQNQWKNQLLRMFRSFQVAQLKSDQCSNLVEYVQVTSDDERITVETFSLKTPTIKIYNENGDEIEWGAGQFASKTSYTNHDNEVQAAWTSDVGVDQGSHSNDFDYHPGDSSSALVVSTASGTLTSAHIMDKDESTILWAAPLRKRFGCTYEYSSAHLFKCQSRFSFTLALNGVDADGFPFRRMQHGHCLK
ncbi:lectin c-type domain-containing protein [Ditylenchus destructor]|nr:lectin c-type domain-containing protein [Ditylenchus destructor]